MKKSIFLFFAAILCAMSVDAKTVYLKAGLWDVDGAKFGCHTWGSSEKSGFMTHVAGDVYSFETLDANTDVIFTRVSPSSTGIWGDGGAEWGRVQTTFQNGKDMFSMTEYKKGTWGVSDDVLYTFTKNSTLYIDFRAIAGGANYPKAESVGIDYSANAGGTVIPVTFTADVTWAKGVEFMKTAKGDWASIPFEVPTAGQNCAQVAADGKSYTWTTYSENCQVTVSAENGTVEGTGTYKRGTSVQLTALPNDGYEFVNWTEGGKEVSTANPYTFTVKDNITLVANFKEAAAKTYTITTNATNGTVEGAATVVEGESVTLTATANPGYKFVNWTVGGVEVSTDNPYTFMPTEDVTVTANFEQLPPETVYFVNAADWTGTINIHAWGGTASETAWPGNPAHKEDYQIGGHDVYSLTAAAGAYANVIFNNKEKEGDAGHKTADLEWTAGKYYVTDGWYTRDEAEEKLATPVQTYDYYVVGTFNSWTNPDPNHGMTLVGDVYKATVTLNVGANMLKVTNGTWENAKGFSAMGAEYEEVSNDTEDGNILITLTEGKDVVVVYNATTGKVTFEGLTEKVVVTPDVITYVLMGVKGDWTTGIALTKNETAEYGEEYVLLDQEILEGDAVKVVTLINGVPTYYCGAVEIGSPVSYEFDEDGNIVLLPGKYDFYFKVNDPTTYEDDAMYIAGEAYSAEPEYMVVEDVITNFVFDTEAWPMVCMGGPSTGYQIEVFLTLTEDADGTLAYEDCSVSLMGTDATFIDGTLSNIDPAAPYADAVLHVQWGGDYYELQIAMSSTPAEPITIEAEDATVTLTEYPTNLEGTEFAYELAMVAEWVNEAESLPYTVEFVIPTFDPTKASGEYNANFYVTGEGAASGMNEGVSVTVTKDGNNVTLTGNVSALNGNAYNVTISGTLPADEPEVITWELNGGELVVEVPTQEELWASFKTAAGLTTLGTLAEITEAGAGKPHNDQNNPCACRIICAKLLDANVNAVFALPEWAWLKAYIMTVQSGLPEASSAAWRYAFAAFFLQSEHNVWPASADFTEAGKPENWGAAYEAAHEVVLPTEPVAEDYVLPTPVKTGYTFVGWYDNAEGTGNALTVLEAGWAGNLYAIWEQDPTTALENIAVEGKAVKAIVNGQLIIIKNGVQYNAQGAVVK